jgi:hypothetical protein
VAPVRGKKTRQNKDLEPRFDSIETEKAPGRLLNRSFINAAKTVAFA